MGPESCVALELSNQIKGYSPPDGKYCFKLPPRFRDTYKCRETINLNVSTIKLFVVSNANSMRSQIQDEEKTEI